MKKSLVSLFSLFMTLMFIFTSVAVPFPVLADTSVTEEFDAAAELAKLGYKLEDTPVINEPFTDSAGVSKIGTGWNYDAAYVWDSEMQGLKITGTGERYASIFYPLSDSLKTGISLVEFDIKTEQDTLWYFAINSTQWNANSTIYNRTLPRYNWDGHVALLIDHNTDTYFYWYRGENSSEEDNSGYVTDNFEGSRTNDAKYIMLYNGWADTKSICINNIKQTAVKTAFIADTELSKIGYGLSGEPVFNDTFDTSETISKIEAGWNGLGADIAWDSSAQSLKLSGTNEKYDAAYYPLDTSLENGVSLIEFDVETVADTRWTLCINYEVWNARNAVYNANMPQNWDGHIALLIDYQKNTYHYWYYGETNAGETNNGYNTGNLASTSQAKYIMLYDAFADTNSIWIDNIKQTAVTQSTQIAVDKAVEKIKADPSVLASSLDGQAIIALNETYTSNGQTCTLTYSGTDVTSNGTFTAPLMGDADTTVDVTVTCGEANAVIQNVNLTLASDIYFNIETEFAATGSNTGKVTAYRRRGDMPSVYIAVAYYSSDNTLVGIDARTVNLENIGSENTSYNFNVTLSDDAVSSKSFVFDSASTLTPLKKN